jgi:hypothetical protein
MARLIRTKTPKNQNRIKEVARGHLGIKANSEEFGITVDNSYELLLDDREREWLANHLATYYITKAGKVVKE